MVLLEGVVEPSGNTTQVPSQISNILLHWCIDPRWEPLTYRRKSCGATTSETVSISWRVRYSSLFHNICNLKSMWCSSIQGLVCSRPLPRVKRDCRHHPAPFCRPAQSRRERGGCRNNSNQCNTTFKAVILAVQLYTWQRADQAEKTCFGISQNDSTCSLEKYFSKKAVRFFTTFADPPG